MRSDIWTIGHGELRKCGAELTEDDAALIAEGFPWLIYFYHDSEAGPNLDDCLFVSMWTNWLDEDRLWALYGGEEVAAEWAVWSPEEIVFATRMI